MSNTKKNIIYSAVLLTVVLAVYFTRDYDWNKANTPKLYTFQGITMGKVGYDIKYLAPNNQGYEEDIDSLLKAFNQSLSTYISNSEISKFNQNNQFTFKSKFFYPVLAKSQEIYELTNGAFDPTVAPLVNAWGFGFKKEAFPDSVKVDSLKELIDFRKISFDKKKVSKKNKEMILDFSAIAKGYAVDVVADFLKEKGIQNYMVIIGGEVVCKGKNQKGEIWKISITDPNYKQKSPSPLTFEVLALDNKAMATSGNYEQFYIKDGKKYAHTINPKTGFPVIHSLLSASVIAKDCMTADALATAFMVLGVEKSKNIIKKRQDIEGFLIYEDEQGKLKTFVSEGVDL